MVSIEKRLYKMAVENHKKVIDEIKEYDARKIQPAPHLIKNLREREKLLKQDLIDNKPNYKSISKRLEEAEKKMQHTTKY